MTLQNPQLMCIYRNTQHTGTHMNTYACTCTHTPNATLCSLHCSCTHMPAPLLWPQQASLLTYLLPLSGLCRHLHSHIQCPTLAITGTCSDMLMAHLSLQYAPLLICSQPPFVFCKHLHSRFHCYPVLRRHLHPHAHSPSPKSIYFPFLGRSYPTSKSLILYLIPLAIWTLACLSKT